MKATVSQFLCHDGSRIFLVLCGNGADFLSTPHTSLALSASWRSNNMCCEGTGNVQQQR